MLGKRKRRLFCHSRHQDIWLTCWKTVTKTSQCVHKIHLKVRAGPGCRMFSHLGIAQPQELGVPAEGLPQHCWPQLLPFAHDPYLRILLGCLWGQTGPQSRLPCFAGLFHPVLISEEHHYIYWSRVWKCSPLSRSLIFCDSWFLKQTRSKHTLPFFPVASLGFTVPPVPFNGLPAFSFRQMSCLLCLIPVCLWCHITVCSKKQDLYKRHINWTGFS